MLIGAIGLKLPFSTYHGISFVDALFTSISAVCVTGLMAVPTATYFTPIGKGIILFLIQLGGLGIMTFALSIFAFAGGNLSLKWRFTFENFYADLRSNPIKSLVGRIVIYTLSIEAIAASILFIEFSKDFSILTALKLSVFHAVSAFCNAGFSLFPNSLIPYQDNPIIIITLGLTIIMGGLGFIVINEIIRKINPDNRKKSLSIHSKIAISMTIALIAIGMFYFAISEWNTAMKNMNLMTKLLTSFFQSVTCRTAGFYSIDTVSLQESTLCVMIMLMFIGGSPGSIAGGVKTTTIAVIILMVISKLKGENQVRIGSRAINHETVYRSMTFVVLTIGFLFFSTVLLMTIDSFGQQNSMLSVLFEMVSAFGTVGLTTGITEQLNVGSKLYIAFVMFMGKLGPLTLLMSLSNKTPTSNLKYPEEQIMIG
jgi:trk system potassium uptake protein TrkH